MDFRGFWAPPLLRFHWVLLEVVLVSWSVPLPGTTSETCSAVSEDALENKRPKKMIIGQEAISKKPPSKNVMSTMTAC